MIWGNKKNNKKEIIIQINQLKTNKKNLTDNQTWLSYLQFLAAISFKYSALYTITTVDDNRIDFLGILSFFCF